MQSAHRKLLDTLNSVGLSDSLMRVIERRQTLDKWIVYGGMVSPPPPHHHHNLPKLQCKDGIPGTTICVLAGSD